MISKAKLLLHGKNTGDFWQCTEVGAIVEGKLFLHEEEVLDSVLLPSVVPKSAAVLE